MVELCAIASGSNGNCYYVGNENEAILVDVGIFTKKVLERMNDVGLDIAKVKAIFISHEHADHMRGVRVLSKKHNIPVYMTQATFTGSWNPNRPGSYQLFEPNVPVSIGDITIHPFIKKHDAAEPCSFRVEIEGKHVGVMTDIGAACDQVKTHLALCHAAFLESNYDEHMLKTGKYPYKLKERVLSDVGHLSNDQAAELAHEHTSEYMELLLLSHLSGENNTPKKAISAFNGLSEKFKIEVAHRNKPTRIYRLGEGGKQLTIDF